MCRRKEANRNHSKTPAVHPAIPAHPADKPDADQSSCPEYDSQQLHRQCPRISALCSAPQTLRTSECSANHPHAKVVRELPMPHTTSRNRTGLKPKIAPLLAPNARVSQRSSKSKVNHFPATTEAPACDPGPRSSPTPLGSACPGSEIAPVATAETQRSAPGDPARHSRE